MSTKQSSIHQRQVASLELVLQAAAMLSLDARGVLALCEVLAPAGTQPLEGVAGVGVPPLLQNVSAAESRFGCSQFAGMFVAKNELVLADSLERYGIEEFRVVE
jgi:hypothetical protein